MALLLLVAVLLLDDTHNVMALWLIGWGADLLVHLAWHGLALLDGPAAARLLGLGLHLGPGLGLADGLGVGGALQGGDGFIDGPAALLAQDKGEDGH